MNEKTLSKLATESNKLVAPTSMFASLPSLSIESFKTAGLGFFRIIISICIGMLLRSTLDNFMPSDAQSWGYYELLKSAILSSSITVLQKTSNNTKNYLTNKFENDDKTSWALKKMMQALVGIVVLGAIIGGYYDPQTIINAFTAMSTLLSQMVTPSWPKMMKLILLAVMFFIKPSQESDFLHPTLIMFASFQSTDMNQPSPDDAQWTVLADAALKKAPHVAGWQEKYMMRGFNPEAISVIGSEPSASVKQLFNTIIGQVSAIPVPDLNIAENVLQFFGTVFRVILTIINASQTILSSITPFMYALLFSSIWLSRVAMRKRKIIIRAKVNK